MREERGGKDSSLCGLGDLTGSFLVEEQVGACWRDDPGPHRLCEQQLHSPTPFHAQIDRVAKRSAFG